MSTVLTSSLASGEARRQRGFHILEVEGDDDEPDVVDHAALTGGLDWDDDAEPRCYLRRDGYGRPRAA